MERWREGDAGEWKKMRENGERERVGERERKLTGLPVTVSVPGTASVVPYVVVVIFRFLVFVSSTGRRGGEGAEG